MNSLKFKILALILTVPLMLVFTTNTIIKGAEILTDIPVSAVEISGEKSYTIDLASEDFRINLDAVITPSGATNKSVSFVAEAVENEEYAETLIRQEGESSAEIVLLSCGTVRITAVADGGRTDSVLITSYSTKTIGVAQYSDHFEKAEGDVFTIGAEDFSFLPSGSANDVLWTSSSPEVASVVDGIVTCRLIGRTVITASAEGIVIDEQTGERKEGVHTASFVVNVSPTANDLGISFGGDVTASAAAMEEAVFRFSYDKSILSEKYGGGFVAEYDAEQIDSAEIILEDTAFSDYGTATLRVRLNDALALGQRAEISICDADGNYITFVTVVKGYLSQSELVFRNTIRTGNRVNVGALVSDASSSEGYYVVFVSDSSDIISVSSVLVGGEWRCYATGHEEGKATISAKIYAQDGTRLKDAEPAPVQVTSITPYNTLSFAENSVTYGLEKRLTVGGKSVDAYGRLEKASFALSLSGVLDGQKVSVSAGDPKIQWTTSDPSIADMVAGKLVFGEKSGEVTITASGAYNEALGENVSASFTFRYQPDGVNIYEYSELVLASANAWPIVLRQNIFIAPLLADSSNFSNGSYREYIEECTTKMYTTAPSVYYDNVGHSEDAEIRYCIEFTADVYGNGYFINAEHITVSARKNFGVAPFNGPLDLVRLYYDNTSPQNVAVKAQDNIVFLVKEDNISITNIELKGCSDSSLINEDGVADLTNLDYCGTVLEVVGDNFSISYSRVNNGRTVARVFGSPAAKQSLVSTNPDAYKIEAYFGNCILTNGREFILKAGSNQVLRTQFSDSQISKVNASTDLPTNPEKKYLYDEAAPYLKRADGSNYLPGEIDEYFEQNYLMTDITLENSVFSSAGLFCIGMECNFAGLCIHRFDYSDSFKFCSELGWKGIAGTSYPARIKMVGDVRFYDWKKVDSVNSDTLVTGSQDILDRIGFNLDIAALISNYDGENASMLTKIFEGEQYVSGAVAFYGGGKNYSVLDVSMTDDRFNALTSFEVPLSMLGERVNLIYLSAGAEPFRFLLYGADSELSPEKQMSDIADNSAYIWVYRGNSALSWGI